jgi:hypothetical protein
VQALIRSVEHHGHNEVGHELERINEKQHGTKQNPAVGDDGFVINAVSPEKDILPVPENEKDGKRKSKTKEALHRFEQFIKTLRHFQRNGKQRYGKSENGIRECLDALNLMTAPLCSFLMSELIFFTRMFLTQRNGLNCERYRVPS